MDSKNKDPKGASFEVSISKEELSQLPAENFNGEIVVVSEPETLPEVVSELEAAPIIGFDTETKPAFQKGRMNQVALLQLATENKAFLIRLCKVGLPEEIKRILEDENILKVGLSIKDDFHSLAKLGEINPGGFVDLQNYVKNFRITDCSLTKIHGIVFGKRISKNQQLTNWEASTLTRRQQEYAALDALACINLYKQLESGKFIPENSPYYKEKCQEEK